MVNLAKFQSKGVGSYVAKQIFNRFIGKWEVSQMPENKPAIYFWEKVVRSYSQEKYEKSMEMIKEPKPHPMVILKFIAYKD